VAFGDGYSGVPRKRLGGLCGHKSVWLLRGSQQKYAERDGVY